MMKIQERANVSESQFEYPSALLVHCSVGQIILLR